MKPQLGGVYRARMPSVQGEDNEYNDRVVTAITKVHVVCRSLTTGRTFNMKHSSFRTWVGRFLRWCWQYESMEEEAADIYQDNIKAGWWEPYPNVFDRHETAMALVISELMEALDGYRKDLMDDHLPQYPMFQVELADAHIRLMDMAGAYSIGSLKSLTDPDPWPIHLMTSQEPQVQLYRAVELICRSQGKLATVVNGIRCVRALVKLHEIEDFAGIVWEKRQYNKQRVDHKKAARVKTGGKKF